MKIQNTLLSTFLIIISMTYSYAQDVHFSQMAYSPLTLNPALAGANSPLQVIGNYRSQWKSVAMPYNTIGASIDARFNERNNPKSGIIAGGLNFVSDNSGDVRITSNNVNLSLAYHLILDKTSTLGVGIYGGFGQRGITPGNEQWGSQYNGLEYDPTMASGEVYNYPTFNFLDAGAGLVYTYRLNHGYMTQNNQRLINGGVAFYHVNRPSNSFITQNDDRMYLRWSIFANGLFGIENTRGALLPGIYFNRQKSNMEIIYGTYYRYMIQEGSKITGFNKPMYLHIGAFHRWGDAIIGKAMLEWYEYSVGFAYDINISQLTRASYTRGGFEIFLRYNMELGGISRSKI